MPKLSENLKPSEKKVKKILLMGDSGTGKTGACVALALKGWNLYIIDFDAQAEEVFRGVLHGLLSEKKISQTEHDAALSRVDIEVFVDPTTIVAGAVTVVKANAWENALKQLNTWFKGGLGTRDIVVIDSLTFAAKACVNRYLALNQRLNKKVVWQDYNEIQQDLAKLLQLLYSPAFSTNVIVNTHIDLVETRVDSGLKDIKGNPIMEVVDTRALPMSIGKALAPTIPQYFNSALVCKADGKENARRRKSFCTNLDT